MKIREENFYLMEHPTALRRLGAGLIDFVLLSLMSFIIFLGCSYQVIKIIPDFKYKNDLCTSQMYELYKISEEAGLLTLNEEGQTYSKNQLFEFYAYKHILNCFETDPQYFIDNGVSNIDNPYSFISAANESNDDFYEFYVKFSYSKNLIDYGNLSPFEYYKNEIVGKYNSIFNLEINEGIIPFKNSFALSLYEEIKGETSGNSIRKLNDFYFAEFDKAEAILKTYSEYSSIYSVYEENYLGAMQYMAFGILISYLIAFIFVIFLPTTISKFGLTLGRYLTKTVMITKDNKIVDIKRKLGHIGISFIVQYFSIFIPFAVTLGTNFLSASFSLNPIFSLVNNLVFCLISVILFVIMYFSIFIRKDNKSFSDILFGIEMRNAKYFIEGK